MTITLIWWHYPTIASILAIAIAVFWPSGNDNEISKRLNTLFRLVPALMFICIVWIIAAFTRG